MKNEINGRKESKTNHHHGKTVVVCPYHISYTKSGLQKKQGCVECSSRKSCQKHVHKRFKESFYIPKEPTLGNDSETWIKRLKCDIKSTKEIQYHYDGTSEVAQRKQVDRVDLKKIF